MLLDAWTSSVLRSFAVGNEVSPKIFGNFDHCMTRLYISSLTRSTVQRSRWIAWQLPATSPTSPWQASACGLPPPPPPLLPSTTLSPSFTCR